MDGGYWSHTVCRGKYDVNLLYYPKHLGYVLEHFRPVLENQLGLKVCLSERDHVAGLPIADNILNSSENSRYCVILFSKDFYEEEWNLFASYEALNSTLRQNNVRVIPVFISKCKVDRKFRQIYHLDITEGTQRQYFWQKLCQSLNVPYSVSHEIPVPPTVEEFYHQMDLQSARLSTTQINSTPPRSPTPDIVRSTSLPYPVQQTPSINRNQAVQDPQVSSTQSLSEQDKDFIKFVTAGILCIIIYKILGQILHQLFSF
ncbi:myeloid differentiation primary response protein MyD88-like [Ptychodera flava]|uniref:myeloid differentiation primary response protein MyD88-like n=1 Tax=Ptychodera flava TaxID=63121 RepID=UPI00396A9B74